MKESSKDLKEKEVELTGILKEFRDALKTEIEIIKKCGQSSILLKNGHRINYDKSNYWYEFKIDYLPTMPEDTPCNLIIGNETYKVTVVSFDDTQIIVSSDVELPPAIASAKLDNGATVLMERMIDRIEVNSTKDNPAGKRMLNEFFNKSPKAYTQISNDKFDNTKINLRPNQEKAVNSAIQNDITYVWGPPGTGKTKVIGEIIKQLYNKNRKVLVVSHTNIAVDGAIDKVSDLAKEEECSVLRLGTSQKDLPEEVTIDYHKKIRGKELIERQNELKLEEEKKLQELKEKEDLLNKFDWIHNQNINELLNRYKDFQEIENEYNISEKKVKTLKNKYNNFLRENDDKLILKNELDGIEIEIKLKKSKIKEIEDDLNQNGILKQKVQKTSNELIKLENEKQEINSKINDYNILINLKQKGAITALMNRNHIKFAEEHKPIEEKNFEEVKSKIEIAQKNLENYNEQIANLEKSLSNEKEKFKDVEKKKALLLDSIVKNKTGDLSLIYKEFETLKEELNKEETIFDNISKNYKNKETELSKELYNEKNKISKFTSIDEIDKYDAFYEQIKSIENIYNSIVKELSPINEDDCKKEKNNIEHELNEILKELEEINDKINQLEKEAIKMAKIVGTTLTKAYIEEVLQECEFDTVILDEASIAPIPALWCACYLAKRNIVLVGDFLQLSPIVMTNALNEDNEKVKKWLGTDVFIINKIPEKIHNNQAEENIIILNEQFRMEKAIADVANIYYGDYCMIESPEKNKDRKKDYDEFYEWYGINEQKKTAVEIIDTYNMHAWVTTVPQGGSSSRMNIFSASLCVELAIQKIDQYRTQHTDDEIKPKILIVAPYKPHVIHIRKIIESLSTTNNKYDSYIKVGTIHSFQGNEADIVIFDFVVDEPHWRANLFLKDEESREDLKRLFNVAITRAKYKLFIVGNIPYLRKMAKNNILGELLETLIDKKKFNVIDGNEAFPELRFVTDKKAIESTQNIDGSIICKEDVFFDYFLNDIKLCKERLIIYSPFMTYNRVGDLLKNFKEAISRNVEIIVITKSLSDRNKRDVQTYQKIEEELKSIGVNIVYKKGMHEKLVFIDDIIVWNGSLNALSNSGNTSEIMHRIRNDKITKEFEELHNISHLSEAVDDKEMYCPLCGGKMELREGINGLYWKCINEDYSRSMDQKFPSNGVWKCHCGGEYEFFMKNEPRWRCVDNNDHFSKIKLFDLHLPKMLEKIPEDDYKRVEDYFEGKINLKNLKQKNRENKILEKNVSKKNSSTSNNIIENYSFDDITLLNNQNNHIEEPNKIKTQSIITTENYNVDDDIEEHLNNVVKNEEVKEFILQIFHDYNLRTIQDICIWDYKYLLDYKITIEIIEIINNFLIEIGYKFVNEFIDSYKDNLYMEKIQTDSSYFYKLLTENGVNNTNIKEYNLLKLLTDNSKIFILKGYIKKYFKIGYNI